jgi:DNA-binding CsgD family transcriptional regulator/tetratricopeptide (TPR) repeat protein
VRVVERNTALAALDRALQDAVAGAGSLTFVAGEAGIGKTTLVNAFIERHADIPSLVGACDNLSTPRPLGPLHDMAERSREIAALIDRSSRHELFVGFLEHLSTPGRPAIVVVEDVHWADAATLDLLRFVGRRVGRSHATVLATYRSDEVGSAHPLRAVLGDLATVPAVSRHTLAPLTLEAVAELAAGTEVDPVALHQRTGGNPFYVTEVLADSSAVLPDTLRDAVLARYSRLGAGARRVLDVASVVPQAIERTLLDAVADPAPQDVDDCVAAGVLRLDDHGRFTFRHELARLAIASALLPARRVELHTRIVEALRDRHDPSPSRITHHADAAGDGDTVLRYAVLAADRAVERGAHQQASDQLARALRYADRLPAAERADLLERYAVASSRSAAWGQGLDEVEQAVALRRQVDDPHRLGNALRIEAAIRYLSGRSPEAYASIDEALRVLEPLGESPELSDALTEAVTLSMLARRHDDAIALSDRAIELAERLDRPRALAAALGSTGAVELLTGEVEGGVAHILRSVEVARAAGLDHEVARGLGNLGSGAGEVRLYDIAEPYLLEAIDYATERDLDGHARYATSWLARVRFETGRWSQAADVLGSLPLDLEGLSAITRITSLAVLGRLRCRRGDPGGDDALAQAWELAAATDDLQRMWPVAAARAEQALLEGRDDGIPALVLATYERAGQLDHPWAIGELGALLWRAGALAQDRREVFARAAAQPYRLQVTGDVRAAAAAWADIGCPYERADVLSDGDEDQQRQALAVLHELGAAPAAGRLRRRMRASGIRSIPRGPRPATAEHPAGLTPREVEVLDLVAEGLTNAQIGEALFITEKTAGHHVSSILSKLDADSRHDAVRIVEQG